MNRDDVYGLAVSLGAQTRLHGNELQFKRCPYCEGSGHDDYTFAVNVVSGAFKCLRASCGKQGHFVELARDFGYPLEFEGDTPKQYRQLPQIKLPVRDGAIKYLMGRGISADIARRYSITVSEKDNTVMMFPFYDENGILTFVKYRKTNFDRSRDKNKEWCERDTKPILFGMKQCTADRKRLVITEGQLDSLSVVQAGIQNAVSVPTGAKGFTWVKFCHEWVDSFDEIVVFGDNEHGHITLANEMLIHFGYKKIKVVRNEDYLGEKDANDILRKYGATAIQTCINNATEMPTKHVKRLSDVESVNLEAQEHIRTGIYLLDKVIGGLYLGTVTVLTGRRGEGKSTLASQIVANTLNQTDNEGQPYSVFIYSGELPNYHFKRWLDLQIAGNENIEESINEYGDTVYTLAPDKVAIINSWYRDRAYIYDSNMIDADDDIEDPESLLETIANEVRRHNIKLVLIDNLMTAVDIGSENYFQAQSAFVNKVKKLAMRYNIAVLLIAHPRKSSDSKLTNDSISGSGDITNRVDTVVTYSRSENSGECGMIGVTKNRLTGHLADELEVQYGNKSKRIVCNMAEKQKVFKCFEVDEYGGEPF